MRSESGVGSNFTPPASKDNYIRFSCIPFADKKISNAEVTEKLAALGKNSDIWIHGKLGGLYVLELISKGGQKANKFITQIINYAGSSTSDSSAYIILKEK